MMHDPRLHVSAKEGKIRSPCIAEGKNERIMLNHSIFFFFFFKKMKNEKRKKKKEKEKRKRKKKKKKKKNRESSLYLEDTSKNQNNKRIERR